MEIETTVLDYLMRPAVFPDSPFIRIEKTLMGARNENIADLRNSRPGYRGRKQWPECGSSWLLDDFLARIFGSGFWLDSVA